MIPWIELSFTVSKRRNLCRAPIIIFQYSYAFAGSQSEIIRSPSRGNEPISADRQLNDLNELYDLNSASDELLLLIWSKTKEDLRMKWNIFVFDVCSDIKHVLIMTIPFTKPIKWMAARRTAVNLCDRCENSHILHKHNFEGDKQKTP